MSRNVILDADDGIGFKTRHINASFILRRDRDFKKSCRKTTCKCYPKANLFRDRESQLVMGGMTGRGPEPDDPFFSTHAQASGPLGKSRQSTL